MQVRLGTSNHEVIDMSGASEPYEIHGLGGGDVIHGTAYSDLIIGGAYYDQMYGNAGDDVFSMTGSDCVGDVVYGGAGFDTILGSAASEVLLLGSISSIERIDSGGGLDILRGTEAGTYWDFRNTALFGILEIDLRGANDDFKGSAGDDRVIGGTGNDVLDGHTGTDTAVYKGNFSEYTLTPLSGGQLRVATANGDGTDTIRGFEILEFADGTYSNGVFTPLGDPGNTAPVANPETYSSTEDVARVVAAPGVLANDSDADGDALTITGFSASSAQGGTVAVNANGSFTYTPKPNFNGADSFSYTVSDGRGGFATSQVTLNVAAVNDAPVAVNNTYNATQNNALVVSAASGVLSNDSDPDGQTLTVGSFSATSTHGGTVAMNANGSFTYTPASGFSGNDSFSYTASDGTLQTGATVNVSVTGTTASTFDSLIAAMPENSWAKLNTNQFANVLTPYSLQPHVFTHSSPHSVIQAWSAATWDANRSEYIFWGGGHYNYEGNEVYTWSAATLQWERASLPSRVVHISGARYETADGPEHTPISSHAYDNLEFLELADRMVNFGGAAAHTGGPFVESDGWTRTGPYFWDPSKADPNKVGGLTGSHVNPGTYPNIVGGEMWENRDIFSGQHPLREMVNGTTDYVRVGDTDVVFVNDTSQHLFKYTIHDVNDPTQDTYQLVGDSYDTYTGGGAGAYDPVHNLYVRTSRYAFSYWDLDKAGPTNRNVLFMPSDPTGQFVLNEDWGMEFDPVRERFVLWKGAAPVWYLEPVEQSTGFTWNLEQAPLTGSSFPSVPSGFRGVLGKWDYVASHDIFLGVSNHLTGDVWAYKPEGWSPA